MVVVGSSAVLWFWCGLYACGSKSRGDGGGCCGSSLPADVGCNRWKKHLMRPKCYREAKVGGSGGTDFVWKKKGFEGGSGCMRLC